MPCKEKSVKILLNTLKVCLMRIYTRGSIKILVQGAAIKLSRTFILNVDKDIITAKNGTPNMKPVQSKGKDHSLPF